MIVAAAIKYGDVICLVPKPGRHHNVLRAVKIFGPGTDASFENEVQGFLTDEGEFLGRKEAYEHAVSCGQGTPRRAAVLAAGYSAYNGPDLYSEDLW